jgi:CRP-like cAMP-binding protein
MISFSNSERFAHLPAADKDRLEVLTKLDQFSPGEELFAAGKAFDWLGIVCSGSIEVRVPGRDGEVVLATLGPGDLFGELEPFAKLPEGVRHVASADTLVRVCPKNPLVQELRAHRPLATGLLFVYARSISEKIRAANDALVRLRGSGQSMPPIPLGRGDRPPHLAEDEAAWLQLLGRHVEVPAGQVVVQEGDTTRSFYVIEEGEAEVRRDVHVLARLGPRDLFGVMSFIDGRPRSASVATVGGPGVFTVLEPDVLDRALGLNFTVAFKFLATMCGILGRTFADTTRQALEAAA